MSEKPAWGTSMARSNPGATSVGEQNAEPAWPVKPPRRHASVLRPNDDAPDPSLRLQGALAKREACPARRRFWRRKDRSEEHTSELQSPCNLVCRLLLEKKKSLPIVAWSHRE